LPHIFACFHPTALPSPWERHSCHEYSWELLWIKISYPCPLLPPVHYFLIWPTSPTWLGRQPQAAFALSRKVMIQRQEQNVVEGWDWGFWKQCMFVPVHSALQPCKSNFECLLLGFSNQKACGLLK